MKRAKVNFLVDGPCPFINTAIQMKLGLRCIVTVNFSVSTKTTCCMSKVSQFSIALTHGVLIEFMTNYTMMQNYPNPLHLHAIKAIWPKSYCDRENATGF